MRRNLAGASLPDLLTIHSDGDQVVTEHATDCLEKSWQQVADLQSNTGTWQIDGENSGVPWSLQGHSRLGQERLVRFGTVGFAHGWLGGPEGKHSNPDAPCVSGLIWWHLNASATRVHGQVEPVGHRILQRAGLATHRSIGSQRH
jgi:hypothetical protein